MDLARPLAGPGSGPDPEIPVMALSEPARPSVLLVVPPGATTRGMTEALETRGLQVTVEPSLLRAVSRFSARPADLVLIDLALLEKRDLEIIPVLREIRASVRILLGLPEGRRALALRGLERGADGYLLVPFYLEELVEVVLRTLGREPPPAPEAGDALPPRLAARLEDAVNNPLQVLELLAAGGPEAGIDPGEIRAQAQRIQEVVDELGAWVRRRDRPSGRARPERVLREALSALDPAPRVEIAGPLGEVAGEPASLARAFRTLASLPAAAVRAEARGEGRSVRIRFHAPGLFLPAERLPGIFRPFESLIRSPLGLAAATARAILEARGGTVRVVSEPEEGTTVIVDLPVLPPE